MQKDVIIGLMIGLKRNTVRLEEHQAEWSGLFEAEAALLRVRLVGMTAGIEHVGSTAVPGLPAKPILDIAVAVSSKEAIPRIGQILVGIGYIDRGDGGNDGGYLFVKESVPDIRTIHLHIVESTDIQWRDYCGFRDLLRRDIAVRREYAGLKQTLAERYPGDRKAYTEGKSDYIRRILKDRQPDRATNP